MRCGDCRNYEPARNPETGRPLPSQEGGCTFPVTWPKLPKSFLPDSWTHPIKYRYVQFPPRFPIWADNTDPCEMFEARTPGKRAAVQMTLSMPQLGDAK